MGLTITKALIEQFDGQLDIKSGGANRGSVITYTMKMLEQDDRSADGVRQHRIDARLIAHGNHRHRSGDMSDDSQHRRSIRRLTHILSKSNNLRLPRVQNINRDRHQAAPRHQESEELSRSDGQGEEEVDEREYGEEEDDILESGDSLTSMVESVNRQLDREREQQQQV